MMLLILLIVLLILAAGGGFYGCGERNWGWYGWSPLGLIIIILLILWLAGILH